MLLNIQQYKQGGFKES